MQRLPDQHPTPPVSGQHYPAPSTHDGLTTLVVDTGPLPCSECRDRVERQLQAHPHVATVHLDARHQVAHVQVHGGMISSEELADLIACCCGDRNPVPLPKAEVSAHAHAHTASAAEAGEPAADHAAMRHR